ncbi:MAG: hypothetical protein NT062_37435, partial [Proteobacteria bacterium]|nr:hypothetical protein [Pseudomonadota bacterium]
MSVQSLLRVMVLRDAEAIILEAGKVPSLRRKGNVEALAMPPLDGKLLAEFAEPLVANRPSTDWPASIPFTDGDTTYQVTIERATSGYRIVARKAKVSIAPPAPPASADDPPAPKPKAWWASRGPKKAEPPAIGPGSLEPSHEPRRDPNPLARLLGPIVAIAVERGASDVILSTGHEPRVRTHGLMEALDTPIDDDELAAAVAAVGNNADLSLELAGTRVRVNAFEHLGGVGVAARLIRDRIPQLADLALPPALLARVIDANGHGSQREGAYFGLWNFVNKLTLAVAG